MEESLLLYTDKKPQLKEQPPSQISTLNQEFKQLMYQDSSIETKNN